MDPKNFKVNTARFGSSSEDEKAKILEGRNRPNTNKSTQTALGCLNAYIEAKGLKTLDLHTNDELPKLLESFYADARTVKGELYHVQTMKSMRSNLNRWFKEKRDVDVIEDIRFNKANLMFKGAKVRSKKAGKGVRKSTAVICDEDFANLAHYFHIDHCTTPNPSVLQRNVIFNIIYYLCRRGQENLYDMTKNWFKVITEHDGQKYLIKEIDELDKNHGEDDPNIANQGKMYDVEGKKTFIYNKTLN